ncbi:hypothetical protein MBLNU459_g2642t1 [Dothideomycetes sp. NU459]
MSVSLLLHLSAAATPTSAAASASTSLVLSAMTYVGCFNSSQPLANQGSYTYQTSGYCQPICVGKGQAVMGLTGGSYCYCGDQLPAKDSEQVDDSNCNTICTGYGDDDCGGTGYWSVYLTGTDTEVSNYDDSSQSSSATSSATATSAKQTAAASTTTQSSPSVITSVAPGKTVVVTASSMPSSTADPETSKEHKSGGTNTAGIAAGVVVGIVVIAGLVGAAFFYMRRRNRRQVEEEYSKRTQAQDFIASGGGNTRGMSVRSNGNDSRLDPEYMAHHRLSDGSIADNQDYSRRILKVTNPDGS